MADRNTAGTTAGATCDACSSVASPAVGESPARRVFRVDGLDCAQEVAALRREVGPLVGGDHRLSFDLLAGQMAVDAPGSTVSDEMIAAAAGRAGLRAAALVPEASPRPDHSWLRRHGRSLLATASAAALLAGLVVHAAVAGPLAAVGLVHGPSLPRGAAALYLLATFAGSAFVLPRAWASARAVRPDMNLLMTLAIAGAIVLGELLEAATVALLFAVALLLESWSVGRARSAVRALLDLTPPVARIRDEAGDERSVPAAQVRVGEIVVVHPGERLPLDGVVVAGRASVDTSPVTGESRPAAAEPGCEVFAGTIAIDGVLELRATRPADDSLAARIVRRVGEARSRQGRTERWVDRFALVYTPVVFVAALLVAVVPPLLTGADWSEWIYRAFVLLVIGCPCALVISTPVSVVAGLTAAARHGVLVKGGDVLERPARVGAVAFDKTGTLTTGRLAVAAVVALDGHRDDDVLGLAAALEVRSGHPIARAIVAEAGRRSLPVRAATDVRVLPGRGAEGSVDGTRAWLGSHRLLVERGQDTAELHSLAHAAETSGRSVVVVGRDGHVCGLIALEDDPRPEAGRAVEELRRLGCERISLLSGDNRATVEAIGARVGIDEVRAGLLPDDKLAQVEALRRSAGGSRYGLVAFVGDGINDAPALAAADVGIACGERATDAAIETADVALIGPALTRIPWLVAHSRRVLNVIRVNVAFALAVKAAFVLLTVVGHASLWAAIAADMGASLLVIGNSLRLLRGRT
jgi:Cd2+/Zn2+-exporting ATPase